MKSYMDVIKERYDGRERGSTVLSNQYSLLNPVGFYGSIKIMNVFYMIFNKYVKEMSHDGPIRILDIGCGSGYWTRYFWEVFQGHCVIEGVDLSAYRIEHAKKMNGNIAYHNHDVVDLTELKRSADVITALDLFMHLNTEEQIVNALNGVNTTLNKEGVFIWLDTYARNHFVPSEDESMGFHPKQMEALAAKSGFVLLKQYTLFKSILGKYHSVYLSKYLPIWAVDFFEKFLPGGPGSIVHVYKKGRR